MVQKKRKKETVKKKKLVKQTAKDITTAKLRKAGYKTVADIARTNPEKLSRQTGLKKELAKKLISSAKNVYQQTSRDLPKETKEIGKQSLKQRIILEAMKNMEFRKKVVCYIVDNLS